MINKNHLLMMVTTMVTFFVLLSCKPKVPSKYIQPKKMEDILFDYHLSQSVANEGFVSGRSDKSSTSQSLQYRRNLFYHTILKKHKVTEAEFDSSLVYYYGHADRLLKIYNSVADRMERNAVSLGANVGDIKQHFQVLTADGDTADIWNGPKNVTLTPYPPYDKLLFHMKGDSTYRKGDSFLFTFTADFIYQDGTKDAIAYIAVRYDNDSIISHRTHITRMGPFQVSVPAMPNNEIKEIEGFVYLAHGAGSNTTLKLMFLSQIRFVRFHPKEDLALYDTKPSTILLPERKDSALDTITILRDTITDTLSTRAHKHLNRSRLMIEDGKKGGKNSRK